MMSWYFVHLAPRNITYVFKLYYHCNFTFVTLLDFAGTHLSLPRVGKCITIINYYIGTQYHSKI